MLLKLNPLPFSGSAAMRLRLAAISIAVLTCATAHAQSFEQTGPASLPDSPRSGSSDSFQTNPGFDRSRPGPADRDNRPGPQHGAGSDSRSFSWNRFLTDATQTGARFAIPRYSTQGMGGSPGGGSFMDGGSSFASGGSMSGMGGGMGLSGGSGMGFSGGGAGMSGGGMGMSGAGGGMRGGGGGSAMALGSGLLRSLADSTGGSLGTTLHVMSGLTDSRSGFAVPLPNSSVNFKLSGSLGNLLGPASMTPSGGSGGQGGGMQSGGVQGGTNAFGGAGGMGGGHGAGGGKGPSVSLSLKF